MQGAGCSVRGAKPERTITIFTLLNNSNSNDMIITEEQKRESTAFFKEAIDILAESGARFMIGGAFAVFQHSGIYRNTKDLDVFCKYSDYSKILKAFKARGFQTELTDVRWLAKIFRGEYFIDLIFDTTNNICKVDDSWFENSSKGIFEGLEVLFLAPEELIWLKTYVQNRERFDGADVHHLILKTGKSLDWKRLLGRLDQHWHLLLAELILFQFIYPSDYQEIVPKWLFDELIARANEQYDLPGTGEKICRGPLIDQTQYAIDIKQWDYKAFTITTI